MTDWCGDDRLLQTGETPNMDEEPFNDVLGEAPPIASQRRLQLLHERLRARLLDDVTTTPTLVGRFELLKRLGAGGMGTVYLARDPALNRHVAIKLLHRVHGSQAARALLNEAQALARLEHPNIVTVFDIGTVADADGEAPLTFVAMEYVPGQDFAAWLRSKPSWQEALRALVDAGQGLAAAHEAGVVHGDFKPPNIVRGDDGRSQVIDFGLARVLEEFRRATQEEASDVEPAVSRWGGTLGYCAPEKLEGKPDSVAGDVFSFCATAYEAMVGELPYGGRTPMAFLVSVEAGIAPRDRRSIPRALDLVLRRGLDKDPQRRWQDLPALLAALQSLLDGYPRRRVWAAGIAGVALVAGSAWGMRRDVVTEPTPDCTGGSERLATLWSPARRATVAEHFAGAKTGYIVDTGPRLLTAVDDYVDAIGHARRQHCEAGRTQAIPESVVDAQTLCLQELEDGLQRLLTPLTEGAKLGSAIQRMYRLPAMDACSADAAVSRQTPLPSDPEQRKKAQEIRKENEQLLTMLDGAEYEAGLAIAQRLVASATALGYGPAIASTTNSVGAFQSALGNPTAAAEAYEAAYFGAREHQMDGFALKIATNLINAQASRGRHDEALRWARHAEAIVDRAADKIIASKLRYATAVVLSEMERYDDAREMLRGVLATRTKILGDDHPTTVGPVFEIATIDIQIGEHARALEGFARVAEVWSAALGPTHPNLALVANNAANSMSALGDPEGAKASWQQALQIREAALGPDHPALAGTLTNLAILAVEQADYETAISFALRAQTIRSTALNPSHPALVGTLRALGDGYRGAAQPKLARAAFERAAQIVEHGPPHLSDQLAALLVSAAEAAEAMGDTKGAVALKERVTTAEHP